jgi:TonB family protein
MKPTTLTILFCLAVLIAGCSSPTTPEEPQVGVERKPVAYSTRSPSGEELVYGNVYGDFEKCPIPRLQAVAIYPQALYENKVTGVAMVRFTLTATGETKDFSVKSDQKEFGAAALAAAKKNKYTLAKKHSEPVECQIELIYRFPGPYVQNP